MLLLNYCNIRCFRISLLEHTPIMPTLSQNPTAASLMPTRVSIPHFVGKIRAGLPSPSTDESEHSFDLNEYLISNKKATFIFDVLGYSMIKAGILDGDKVIVDRSRTAKNNDIVVAVVNGEFTIKRLVIDEDQYELHPDSDDFDIIRFNEGDELEVWGVVKSSFRTY